MSDAASAAFDRFRDRQADLEADLEALVGIESPSDDPAAVTRCAEWLCERLGRAGVAAELRRCSPRGAAVLAHTGEGTAGTLLLGHHDTVWPVGTLAERPYALRAGRATGPGCFDMKAGLAVAVAVLEALALRAPPSPVVLLSVPDEEVGGEASRELLLATARRCERVLVLEPSADGAAKVARKGTGQFELRFRGRAAHAGLEPEKGASALAELARAVGFAESLADAERGTSVTPTVARAGTAVNVVPEHASLQLDARVWSLAEGERVERALRSRRPEDPRVECEVLGGFDRPPLEPTAESDALFERARSVAERLGGSLAAARVGGASDGNLTAAAGVATLDGLGPRGGGAHAPDEWVDAADLPFRAALLLGLVGGY
jgi:glutamate carboxypeptidase